VPKLHLVENVPFLTMPDLVDRLAKNRISRAMSDILGRVPFYLHLVRHLRYALTSQPTV
jgi:hypothetical protein